MGTNCELAYDACADEPCENGAACTKLRDERTDSDDFSCTCASGFTGTRCEENIDDCVSVVCPTYQVCFDGINNYTCSCPPGYKVKYMFTKLKKDPIELSIRFRVGTYLPLV